MNWTVVKMGLLLGIPSMSTEVVVIVIQLHGLERWKVEHCMINNNECIWNVCYCL